MPTKNKPILINARIPVTKRDRVRGYTRIKAVDLPVVRNALLKQQDNTCPLCERNMSYIKAQQRCVDHDHSKQGASAGAIRGVLCSNCNGNEGRIRNRVLVSKGHLSEIEWLKNLLDYWVEHKENQTGLIHHTHKTPNEERLLKNKKARAYRKRLKKGR